MSWCVGAHMRSTSPGAYEKVRGLWGKRLTNDTLPLRAAGLHSAYSSLRGAAWWTSATPFIPGSTRCNMFIFIESIDINS
jgi:hypothetical protein